MKKTKDNSPCYCKKKVRNDIVLVAVLLLVVSLAALCFFLFGKQGDFATVTVEGRLYGEYSLNENITVEIKSDGGGYNILAIEDGRAYIKEASCPDGICSSHRPIDKQGESIICLPNKVVVEVKTIDGNESDIIN
jgi:hypothetical protein